MHYIFTNIFFYLTTALTYGELLFSCAFGDGPIEVTV